MQRPLGLLRGVSIALCVAAVWARIETLASAAGRARRRAKETTTWEARDFATYSEHTAAGVGQIGPEDPFGEVIQELARNPDLRTFLEIGTWNGMGSTRAFVAGFAARAAPYEFYSLECNADKAASAQALYAHLPHVHVLNEVLFHDTPVPAESVFPDLATNPTLQGWHRVDMENMRRRDLFLQRPGLPAVFDVVLLDGGEFTTYFEFQALKHRCRWLLLDDTRAHKCFKIVEEIERDPAWEVVVKNDAWRNGFLVARRRAK